MKVSSNAKAYMATLNKAFLKRTAIYAGVFYAGVLAQWAFGG